MHRWILGPAMAISLLSGAAEVPPRPCDRAARQASLEADGRYRCLGLPVSVAFPTTGTPVSRLETADAVVLTQVLPAGTLMFVHRPFPWGGRDRVDETLDTYVKTVLSSVDARLQLGPMQPVALAREELGRGAHTARGAKFTGRAGDGEAWAVLARTWLSVMVSFGKPGSPYAYGGAGARAFFQSYQSEWQSGPAGTVPLSGGVVLALPKEAWELTARSPDPRQRIFHMADPEGLLMVRDLPRIGSNCAAALDREEEALRHPQAEPGAGVEVAKVTRDHRDFGDLVGVEATGTAGDVRGAMFSYLFCSPAAGLTQLILMTPKPYGAASSLLYNLVTSLARSDSPKAEAPAAGAQGQAALRVAMSGSYWPLHAPGGEPAQRYGLEADLAGALAAELGMPVKYLSKEEIGAGGSLQAVAQGRADIALNAITPSDERRALVAFTAPYLTLQMRLAAPAGASGQTLEWFNGKRGAAPKGPAFDLAKEKLPGAKLVAVSGLAAGARMLRANKVDFLAGEDVGLWELIEADPGLEMAVPVLGPSPLAAAVPRGAAARYDAALKRLSGFVSKLQQIYRPGLPMAPDEVFAGSCARENRQVRWVRVAARGTLNVVAVDPPPDTAGRYWLQWGLEAAPSVETGPEEAGAPWCATAPVRMTQAAPPGLAAARTRAVAMLRKEAGAADLDASKVEAWVQEKPQGWFRAAEGTLVTVLDWGRTGGCGPDYAICSANGFLVLAFKGGKCEMASVITGEVRQEKPSEGT